MDTLHTASSQIVELGEQPKVQGSPVALWAQALCPLLQGIARYCCDSRTMVSHGSCRCLYDLDSGEVCFDRDGSHFLPTLLFVL